MKMKRIFCLLLPLLLLLSGCSRHSSRTDIAATTLPVWEFTSRLCSGTDLQVTRLVTDSVSCLHDYSLNVEQVKAVEQARVTVISGAGLEDFLADLIEDKPTIDASEGIELLCGENNHDHGHDHGHSHEVDPHIWLSPDHAIQMARNICRGLCAQFPEHRQTFEQNLISLESELQQLLKYGKNSLSTLSCREIITFHDGFSYLAESFGLTILEAIEEESGSEASAAELKHLIGIVREHALPALFTEANGSASAAQVIARETGIPICTLDMAMGGDSYFTAMYHNIDTLKEALE